jgi:hypothetical protein
VFWWEVGALEGRRGFGGGRRTLDGGRRRSGGGTLEGVYDFVRGVGCPYIYLLYYFSCKAKNLHQYTLYHEIQSLFLTQP